MAVAMKTQWKWVLGMLGALALLAIVARIWLIDSFFEMRIHQTTEIAVFDRGTLTVLTSNAQEAKEVVEQIHLQAMERCSCGFETVYMFRNRFSSLEVYMSDHALVISSWLGWFEYKMPPGVCERIRTLCAKNGIYNAQPYRIEGS